MPSSIMVARSSDQLMDDHDLSRFRTKACQRHVMGCCEFQIRCQYSHTPQSLRRCPFLLLKKEPLTILRYLPMYCDSLKATNRINDDDCSRCTRGSGCPFAHNEEEILYHPLMYKQKLCPFYHCNGPGANRTIRDTKKESRATCCPKYYCPFVHELTERRFMLHTYFLAPSFVKKVVLHLPLPLSSIPVSMLNTGKLTELKSIPDDLLESLLVTRATATKSSIDKQIAALLDRAQLHVGSLCLVGISYSHPLLSSSNASSLINSDKNKPERLMKKTNDLMLSLLDMDSLELSAGMSRPGNMHEHATTELMSHVMTVLDETGILQPQSRVQYLTLSPGETVELLGPFPIPETRDWSQIFFYGRTTTTGHEGWFPSSILIGVEELDTTYHANLHAKPHANMHANLIDPVIQSSHSSSMGNPLVSEQLESDTCIRTRLGNDAMVPPTLSAGPVFQSPAITTASPAFLMHYMPVLRQLCSELETCLLLEFIQGIVSVTAAAGLDEKQQELFGLQETQTTSDAHFITDAKEIKDLKLVLNRLQVSLSQLEEARTMKLNHDDMHTLLTPESGMNKNKHVSPACSTIDTFMSTQSSFLMNPTTTDIEAALLDQTTEKTLLSNLSSCVPDDVLLNCCCRSPCHHRISAASTRSGCGDDECKDHESDGRQRGDWDNHWDNHWDNQWDIKCAVKASNGIEQSESRKYSPE